LLLNPRYRGRAITLTFDQFKYGWTNALDEDEAKDLYDTYPVAGSGIALAQMADANLNPWTESKVDTKNPDRGPVLILDGEKDHTGPWAIANASYKRQKRLRQAVRSGQAELRPRSAAGISRPAGRRPTNSTCSSASGSSTSTRSRPESSISREQHRAVPLTFDQFGTRLRTT
jgi:hypothetical protein